jgi:hypothetical protein
MLNRLYLLYHLNAVMVLEFLVSLDGTSIALGLDTASTTNEDPSSVLAFSPSSESGRAYPTM